MLPRLLLPRASCFPQIGFAEFEHSIAQIHFHNNNYYKMMFHHDAVPSSPDALHAVLRQRALVPQDANQVVEEYRATTEMQPVPESSPLQPPSSTPESSATAHCGERMTPLRAAANHPDGFRPRERRKQHRRRFTPPVTSFDHFEDDERDVTTFEVPPVGMDDRATIGVGMAGSLKKKRGHRRNNCVLLGDSFGFA